MPLTYPAHSDTPGEAEVEPDIEVTPEMIEAGMAVIMSLRDSGDSYDTEAAILAEAYRAMDKARRLAGPASS